MRALPARAARLVLALSAMGSAGHVHAAATAPPLPKAPWFVERGEQLGVRFTHRSGAAGRYLMPEIMGPGVVLADFDRDGDLDLFLVQGGDLAHPPGAAAANHGLFRNDLAATGALHFTAMGDASGLRPCAYGMGATAGDYDGDGLPDLFVACLGQDQLWHNEGPAADGTLRFREVTAQALPADVEWGVSAAFVDYDRDGKLDLFVGNYLKFSLAAPRLCRTPSGAPDYCGPVSADAVPSRLLHNRGDGTFEDVTARAGLLGEYGPALGVSTADLNGDGWPDLYVANDETANQLWVGKHDGTFRNEALLAGVALSGEGATQASMGLDAGDYDGDGDLDLAIANLDGEGDTLYRNEGGGLFTDVSLPSGVRAASLPITGFGGAWIDVDNDSRLDLVVVGGAIKVIAEQRHAGETLPLRQPKQLLHNEGNGRFTDATGLAGPAFTARAVSRGAAFGDLDNDGDVDVVVADIDARPEVLLDQIGSARPWLGLRLLTGPRHSDALGAMVVVERRGAPALLRRAHADGSYASASDPRVLVGLGDAAVVTRVVVTWPSGRREAFHQLVAGRYTDLVEGTGEALP